MSNVVIVGAGVVGAAIGRSFAARGHDVHFVDVDERRVKLLRNQGYDASDEVGLVGPPGFVFLTVPTPVGKSGYDLTALEDAVRSVGAAIRTSSEPHTVVVRSTVAPGTCDRIVAPLLEECSGRRLGDGFALASSPEFLRKATADEDAFHPWITVVGAHDHHTRDRLRELFEPLGGEIVLLEDPTSVELVKCAHNAWNAAKISFFNQLWLLSNELDVDPDLVAETVVRSAEASFNPTYGIRGGAPFGASCLAKDLEALLRVADAAGVPTPLLEAVLAVNELVGDPEEHAPVNRSVRARPLSSGQRSAE